MIETIYRMENNEKGRADVNIRLPKNIKQIGQTDGASGSQIYIEENVIAFIKQRPEYENQLRYGVLLGEIKKGNGYTYIFINGLIEVEEVIESAIIYSEEVWTSIYDSIKRYYKEGTIVGWYGSFDSDVTIDMQRIRKIHLDHFAGNHKVFFKVDRQEDEEAFYIYEGHALTKQSCYHVYFDKSESFEDYLFSTGHLDREPKQREAKSTQGKYGIALNNSVGGKVEKQESAIKWNLGKVASWGTILALTGVLAAMGLNGDLDALGQGIKGMANNVLNGGEEEPDIDSLIPINGSPTNNENKSTTENGQTTEDDSTTPAGAEVSSSKNDSTSTSEEESTTENEETTEEEETTIANNEKEEEETTTTEEEATPSAGTILPKSYIIEKGDTLYSIAMEFYGDADKVAEIVELNKLDDEDYVMEGQKIFLP